MRRALIFLLLIYLAPASHGQLTQAEGRTLKVMIKSAIELIHRTDIEVWKVDVMRQSYRGNGPYEIGFLTRTTEERYRKMVDLYNASVTLDVALRTRDTIMFLQKIEKLHWDITHLVNMLHEVEKKYKIRRISLCLGLDMSVQKIMSELSWSAKTKFLQYMDGKHNKSTLESADSLNPHVRRARSIYTKTSSRREWNASIFAPSTDDDSVMKMKLFRLMYETVKDSDLKIKRAELVKADYENSTGFDLGYVVGDVSDKLSVMEDIAKTLKRLYDVWKPVEHVNAYEQIANLAIEVTHLVDMVRVMMTSAAGAGQTQSGVGLH